MTANQELAVTGTSVTAAGLVGLALLGLGSLFTWFARKGAGARSS
jgi:LPXTG-motif cell wall-anchored protein